MSFHGEEILKIVELNHNLCSHCAFLVANIAVMMTVLAAVQSCSLNSFLPLQSTPNSVSMTFYISGGPATCPDTL